MMTLKQGDLHHLLFLAYKCSHADLTAHQCHKNANKIWKTAKEKFNNKEKFIEHITNVIRELKAKATKKKATMLSYFTQLPMKTSSTPWTLLSSRPNVPSTFRTFQQKQDSDDVTSSACSSHTKSIVTEIESNAVKRKMSDNHDEKSEKENVLKKPAQEALIKKVSRLQQKIYDLTGARDTGTAKDDVHVEIKKLRKELKEEKHLKKKRDGARKFRAKEKIEKTECQQNKSADESLCSRPISALKSVLPDDFLPPPCPIFQRPSKFEVPSYVDKGSCKFSSLLVRLSVSLSLPLEEDVLRFLLPISTI